MEDIDVLTYGLENSEYSEAEMRLDEILESEVFQDILEKIREYQSDLVVLVPDGNTS
jgi:hypothetical protein